MAATADLRPLVADPDDGARTGPSPVRRPRRRTVVLLALLSIHVVASATAIHRLRQYVEDIPLPGVAAVDLVSAFFDVRPIRITTTLNWTRTTEVVEVHRLLTDHTIWLRMFFRDWDQLPPDLRDRGLAGLLQRHAPLLSTRTAGASLTTTDWDWIPQPVRAMAFVNMIEHWAAVDRPGSTFDLDPDLVLRTLKAICMTESWFEHRAIHANADGSRDLGLPQASDYARTVTRSWSDIGSWPLVMDDPDYFNPWLATRWLVLWFDLMIKESGGDLDLAIRAYNVGRPRAPTAGDAYLEVVHNRRRRYFGGPSGSPSWATLSAYRLSHLDGGRVTGSRTGPAGPPE